VNSFTLRNAVYSLVGLGLLWVLGGCALLAIDTYRANRDFPAVYAAAQR